MANKVMVRTSDGKLILDSNDDLFYGVPPAAPDIVSGGLILHIDAGNPASYPGTGTTINDLSGNNHNGTLVGGVGYSGDNGGVLTFDGVDDHINFGGVLDAGSASMSYALWIYIPYIWHYSQYGPPDVVRAYMSKGGYDTPHGPCNLYTYEDKLHASDNYDAPTAAETLWSLTLGWHYIVSVRDADHYQRKLYVDGQLIQTINLTSIGNQATGSSDYLLIGGLDKGVAYGHGIISLMTGSIGAVQVYTKALIDEEVLHNFDATKSRFGL